MPRNVAKPLSADDIAIQRKNFMALRTALSRDEQVCLRYSKRDGENGQVNGKVRFFSGKIKMDTGSVTINDFVKGNRTVNLHRITAIEPFSERLTRGK